MATIPPSTKHQGELTTRLEDEDYRLCFTSTHDVKDYTFVVNSFQPIGANPSAAERFVPVITRRIDRTLARQNSPVLGLAAQMPRGHGAGRR